MSLSELRLKLKKDVEATSVFGERPYEVWIHEKATEDLELDAWDECLRQARECDIFVALYNGHAGATGPQGGSVGICQAELNLAYSQAPGKVFIVNIFEPSSSNVPSRPADKQFQKFVEEQYRFGRMVKGPGAIEGEIRETIVRATVKMVQRGVIEASRGKGYLGPALDWNRQSYLQRRASMIAAVRGSLGPSRSASREDSCVTTIGGSRVLVRLGAVPDAMSVAAAREMVGQPHLADHDWTKQLANADGGPVHLVACHKSVTEAQAKRMLGFPNATVVNGPFGIYVADSVQAIQLVLIANCQDETRTQHGVQRFQDWLAQSEQSELLVRLARKRRSLVTLLAKDA
ncbi:hypothetical protein GCM10007857_19940 [Bradyrhizobium iriomotense]|uniref:DUF4062 domain-containing protein n=1 Tax=Bradyrhizobium iriomotense TaxID=441950 RepID=A0ABQ6ASS8_9BRAD|nr:hypothetical protein GCM10007857_19940 [Bradyrhizobium iriomotense]